MPASTDALLDGTECIQQCIPGTDMKLAVLISLFAQIAGVSTDTNSLISGAKCIQQCIPEGMMLAVLVSLASQIVSGGGTGGSGGAVTCGNGAPTSTPSSGCGIYIQLDSTPPGLYWSYFGGQWNA